MRNIIRYIKTAGANLAQNPILNIVSTATIALALSILGAFLLLQVNLEHVLEASSHGLAMSAYVEDGQAGEGLERLGREIAGLEGVEAVTPITKEEALEMLKQDLGRQDGLLEGLDENPLPASLEIELTPEMGSPDRIEALAVQVGALPGVSDVSFAWEWAEKFEIFVRFVRLTGVVVGGLLFLVIIFIIANTMKLTMLSRQDELYIMRLIGATEWFVRTPFIIEGAVQGLAGSLTALAMLYSGYILFVSRIELPFGLSAVELTFLPESLVWFILGAGTFTGLLGSFISMGRMLRR